MAQLHDRRVVQRPPLGHFGSKQVAATDPNFSLAVNGWVHGGVSYPSNRPPWNNDVWFHLADGSGWVSFAGVRSAPTIQDPSALDPDGGPPVDLLPQCQGAAQ